MAWHGLRGRKTALTTVDKKHKKKAINGAWQRETNDPHARDNSDYIWQQLDGVQMRELDKQNENLTFQLYIYCMEPTYGVVFDQYRK